MNIKSQSKILFFFILSFLIPSNYNTPYIDLDETLHLKSGMTKDAIVKSFNEPLYISFGDSRLGIEKWVYEVRDVQVKSNMFTPDKYNDNQVPGDPIHRLELTFKNDKLVSWKPLKNKLKVETKTTFNILEHFHASLFVGYPILINSSFGSGSYLGYKNFKIGLSIFGSLGTVNDKYHGMFLIMQYKTLLQNYNVSFGPAVGGMEKQWWTYNQEDCNNCWNQQHWSGFGLQTTLSKRWHFVEPTIALFTGLLGSSRTRGGGKEFNPIYIQVYFNFILD